MSKEGGAAVRLATKKPWWHLLTFTDMRLLKHRAAFAKPGFLVPQE
jgi:hypothetical protein